MEKDMYAMAKDESCLSSFLMISPVKTQQQAFFMILVS